MRNAAGSAEIEKMPIGFLQLDTEFPRPKVLELFCQQNPENGLQQPTLLMECFGFDVLFGGKNQ